MSDSQETVGQVADKVKGNGVYYAYGFRFEYLGGLTIQGDGTWTKDE